MRPGFATGSHLLVKWHPKLLQFFHAHLKSSIQPFAASLSYWITFERSTSSHSLTNVTMEFFHRLFKKAGYSSLVRQVEQNTSNMGFRHKFLKDWNHANYRIISRWLMVNSATSWVWPTVWSSWAGSPTIRSRRQTTATPMWNMRSILIWKSKYRN